MDAFELELGFNLPQDTVDQLVTLMWIWGQWPIERPLVSARPLFGESNHGSVEEVRSRLAGLASGGWVELENASYNDPIGTQCRMLPKGEDLAQEIQRRRADLRERTMSSRDALLRWLYDCELRGNPSPRLSVAAMGSFGVYLAESFSEDEINKASRWLRDKGYLTGKGALGGGVLRPVITTEGQDIVEQNWTVNAPRGGEAPSGGTQYNFNAQVGNVAANSSNFTQQATVTGTPEQAEVIRGLAELIDLAQSRIAEVDESAGAIAGQVAADLQQAIAEGAPQPARLAGLLDKVTSLSATGAGGLAMVNALVFQALTLRQQLGLG